MLVIVFECERFHDYLSGQREITAEIDHEPLEAILKKPFIKQISVFKRYFVFRYFVICKTITASY